MEFLTTVTGSYPRQQVQKDTLRKKSVNEQEALEMIKWATQEQTNLGLDIITDGEGYRENMYWFYQLRLDGVDAINKKYKHFSTGGSMERVDLSKTHGTKGFGIIFVIGLSLVPFPPAIIITGILNFWEILKNFENIKFLSKIYSTFLNLFITGMMSKLYLLNISLTSL